MFKYLLVLILCGLSFAEICPPADKLSPCSCDENKKTITCKSVRGRFDIKGVFDRVGPLIPDTIIFDNLEIFDCSSLLEIPENAIQTLKFVSIDISMNENLEYIHPNAFNATYSVTTNLSIWNNYISNDSPQEHDIYNFLNKFKKIESIWIPGNQLSTVPENAFDSLPKLYDLYLGSNQIKSIGSKAFSKLSNMKKLYLSVDSISNNAIAVDAFESVSKSLNVDLTFNNYQFLDESSFKTLLDNVKYVSVGGSACGMSGCSYIRLTCDSRANWICKDMDKYQNKLGGFLCDTKYDNIWEYCKSIQINY